MASFIFPISGMSWADFRNDEKLRGADGGVPGRGGWHYRRNATHVHRGIDLKAPIGTPVLAIEDGTAEFVLAGLGKARGGGGHRVRLHGTSGALYHYLHLGTDPDDPRDAFSPEFLPAGDQAVAVSAGTVLGFLGHTGGSVATGFLIPPSAAHLHFQYHPGGQGEPDANPAHVLARTVPGLELDGVR